MQRQDATLGCRSLWLGILIFSNWAALAAQPADWNGVWLNSAAESRLLPMDGKPLPFTPEGRARYEKTSADLGRGAIVDDAVHLCLSQGLPRAMSSPYPFQIVVTPGQVTFLYEENRSYRIVRVADQHADPVVWDPSYMGDGIATWTDGNRLAIDSTNFKSNRMYLDPTGLPASEQLHVSERLQLQKRGTQLEALITIDDPVIFTRPWTARRVYERHDDIELKTDWVCGEPHRELSATTRKARRSAAAATAVPPRALPPLTNGQLSLNGFWYNAEPPGGGLAIAKAAAGRPEIAAGAADMLHKQLPWAAADHARAEAAMAAGQYVPTPEMQCLPSQPPGTGRIAPGGYGLEILVTPRHVVILAEANAIMRIVRLDRPHPVRPEPGWQGDSVGRWESDALIIDTTAFRDGNYLERGFPFTARMHIVERMRVANGQLINEATLDDPGAFSSPFDITRYYRRGAAFQEYLCQENNHEGGVPTATGRPTDMNVPGHL